jgi:hypothetical protein
MGRKKEQQEVLEKIKKYVMLLINSPEINNN